MFFCSLQASEQAFCLCPFFKILNLGNKVKLLVYIFRQAECRVMTSKKLPLWLVWENPDTMADVADMEYCIMFKNGDGIYYFL